MESSDARVATRETKPEAVPKWLQLLGIGLGAALVPPIVLPIFVLVMGLGMLAFLPFLPLLLAEFYFGARTAQRAEQRERELVRDSDFGLGTFPVAHTKLERARERFVASRRTREA